MPTSMLPSQRQLFDVPDAIAYFNCAYNAPQLIESRNRLLAGVCAKGQPWQRTPGSFFEDAETIRGLASNLFGGDADGYAVVPAASYGVSTAARAVEPTLGPGDRILVIAEEFPSNVLPWRRTARETGAEMVTVAPPERGGWTQAILDKLDRRVRVVAVSTCHWTNGTVIDVRPIASACRETGAALAVDATQTLGAIPLAMADIKPDFLVAAGYKWLLWPYGVGLLYVSEQWRGARPLEETWLARSNAANFAALVEYSDTYMPGARRFDVGEKCTPTLLPGAIAALEQVRAWGIASIEATLAATNRSLAACLERLGFDVPPERERSAHMFGATLPPGYAGDLVGDLMARQVYISRRGNHLRFAPHLHVNDADVDRLVDALCELVR